MRLSICRGCPRWQEMVVCLERVGMVCMRCRGCGVYYDAVVSSEDRGRLAEGLRRSRRKSMCSLGSKVYGRVVSWIPEAYRKVEMDVEAAGVPMSCGMYAEQMMEEWNG